MKELLKKTVEAGLLLDLVDGKLKLFSEGNEIDPELLNEIKSKKEEITAYLIQNNIEAIYETQYEDISIVPIAKSYPVSDAQRRLWVLSQFEEGSRAYNVLGNINLSQDIDVACFKLAVDATIERHEILRTIFKEDESGEIKQWILKKEVLGFEIDYRDFREVENKEESVQSFMQKDAAKLFDLEKGPLLRAALLQVNDKEYIFHYNMHHIISDGWSIEVLSKDVFYFYEAHKKNKGTQETDLGLEKLRIQYKDYSAWQLAQLKEESFKEHRTYWLESLAGDLPLLNLPTSKKRPKLKTNKGHGLSAYINSDITGKLKKYSEDNGGSMFMGLLAAWNILIYRYTSQANIIIGTPIAGRNHADLQDQIGFYINMLALRNEIKPDENFNTFYQTLKRNTLKSYNHQMYPFDRLIEELNLPRDISRNPVFDVMLTFQNKGEMGADVHPVNVELKKQELNRIVDIGISPSKFDIELTFQEVGDYVSLQLKFNPDVYQKEMAEGLIKHFKQLLVEILESPDSKIRQLDYLSKDEKEELLFNDNEAGYPLDKTIINLFLEQVTNNPNNAAVRFEDKELTYQELNEKSNELAHYLQKNYAIEPGDLVGVKQERSEWLIVTILGVLKSGGAYVPIDPDNPQERIDFIEKDTNCKVCIDEIELNKFKADQGSYSKQEVAVTTKPNNTAYVIYTSGSTGKPKGVLVAHQNVVRLFKTDRPLYDFTSSDCWTMFHSCAFDVSVWEMFGALLFGGKLIVVPQRVAQDPNAYLTLVNEQRVTIVNQTPSAFYNLSKEAERLNTELAVRYVIFAGEALKPNRLQFWHERYPSCRLINMYGITETTVHTTFKEIDQEIILLNISNIGKAMPTVSCIVLDENKRIVPKGVAGELYVGGKGVTQGYLNRESLNAERFTANPFADGERLYRTGDKVKQLVNGDFEYIGRIDDQVKIRGYRIELGEIEYALLKHIDIENGVVLAKENKAGDQELVAYFTSNVEQNTSDLRAYLNETLPLFMLPTFYVQIEKLPLTSNGKIDKKALPNPEGIGLKSGVEYMVPSNPTEEKLVKIWEAVLKREEIGVKDDFFNLGGHSLKIMRLINEYQKIFEVKLTINELFINTTLESHSTLVNSAKKAAFIQIEKVADQESYLISDAQRRLWILSQFKEGSIAYNLPNSIYINQDIDMENFKRAIDATIDRHEILRTVFKDNALGELRQWILNREDLSFEIDYHDFRLVQNKTEKVQSYISTDYNKAFDLENGPLLSAALLQVEDEVYVFYFNMHHIISDGWSMEVLSKDVFEFYAAFTENRKPALEKLRIQYKDYSAWQLSQLEKEPFQVHRIYWLKNLAGNLTTIDLPSTLKRSQLKSNNGHTISTHISANTNKQLKEYVKEENSTLFLTLLTAWNILMYRNSGQKDIIIGTPIAGREHADLGNQIGFYVNMIALRSQVNPQESFTHFHQTIKTNTLESYNHQMYPFDRLVEELDLERSKGRNPVFDVMFILQNNTETEGQNGQNNFELSEQEVNRIVDHGKSLSKFDLEISLEEKGEYIFLNAIFNTDVYEKEMVEGLIIQYKELLNNILANPDEKIAELTDLPKAQKDEQLVAFNNSTVDYSNHETLLDLFAAQVEKSPERIALVFPKNNEATDEADEIKELTYKELDEQSNQLANYLKEQYKLETDDLVGIKLERSEWILISILAVLKTGAAYVPIDPAYPQARIDYIEKDAKSKVCINKEELEKFQIGNYESFEFATSVKTNDLAYVIYTSGSTGQPKGVMIEHGAILNTLLAQIDAFQINENHIGLQFASFSFDASISEAFIILLTGAKLVLADDYYRKDPKLLADLIDQYQIDIATLPPSYLNKIDVKALKGLKKLITAGESARYQKAIEYLEFGTYYNAYGPTESSICGTIFKLENKNILSTNNLPIGKPISNTQIYVLNEGEGLLPKGVIGEICIGGAGLARGYLNQPELTNEKFINNPFKEGDRLYKTGDLGRWLPDGNIEFIGRKDDQVKIRGYRIELGEIEHALLGNAEIEQAIVLAKLNPGNVNELVAYITSSEEQNVGVLRSALKEVLPEYMLPTYFVQLDEFLLTPNGKIDKRSLPEPDGLEMESGVEYVAPRNEIEQQIVVIWEMVLNRKNIGINDDFHELGGYSVKAIGLVAEYNKTFSVRLTLQEIYQRTKLHEHGELIEIRNWVKEGSDEEVSEQKESEEENLETFEF